MLFNVRRVLLFVFIILALIIGSVVAWPLVRDWWRYGEATAVCPGPDLYGYRCEPNGDGLSYIDATTNAPLYEDDGFVVLPLPFSFTFYGQSYNEVTASSNGYLQFGGESALYENVCPGRDEAAALGEMIAPYWDDLDLTALGTLQYEVVGSAPERIFVVEWDSVPQLADSSARMTFEVQLFEGSDDVGLLYKDVTSGRNGSGRSATVGQQSGLAGVSLTHSCNQAAVSNGMTILLKHPEHPNPAVGAVGEMPTRLVAQPPKGVAGALLASLNSRQSLEMAMASVRTGYGVGLVWQRADVTGNGRDELVVMHTTEAGVSELLLFGQGADEALALLGQVQVSQREGEGEIRPWRLFDIADRMGDGQLEIIVEDSQNQRQAYGWANDALVRMR